MISDKNNSGHPGKRLRELGLTPELENYIMKNPGDPSLIARVIREHRERYAVSDGKNEYDAEITGNMRYSAVSRRDFPAVGDWVTITPYGPDQAVINGILPRKSLLTRQAVGKPGEIQIISANIDYAFIVQAISNNFNINRLERYLTVCYSAGIEPLLVLSKTDLVTRDEMDAVVRALEKRESSVKHIMLSNVTREGIDKVISMMKRGITYCVIGSSGVGKSTLINTLLQREALRTGAISTSTNKGRHVTEHRELFVLENGSIIIDTPGMKELGLTDDAEGLNTTFGDILRFALECRFPDCRHLNEVGCAVLEAVEKGTIDRESYENYLKMMKEQERYTTTVAEKRRREKHFGKMLKNYHRLKRENGEE
ncbi:MAG: ribosome small subunit-dependent GTPase A [Bacteroidales bacterium]|jgi:ribosome biogenesis GTPase|nr:ribosome small subunit-dependent GTPase A [Bacteroidales bacterium]